MSVNYKELFDQAFKLHNQGNLIEAEKLYNILLQMSPEDFSVLNLYGLLCIAKKDTKKAISLLSKAVVLSKAPAVINNLAKAHLSSQQYEKAIKLFEQAIKLNPKDDDYYYSMAIACKKANKLEKAADCYKKALNINPDNYNACYNLVVIYRDLKMYKEAIQIANKCIYLKPDTEEVYSLLSYLYECVNDLPSAIKSLEKAIQITPSQYLFVYNLAVLYSKIGDFSNSILNYKKVLLLKPDSVAALVNLSTLDRKRDPNLALSYILEARKLAPKAKNVVLNLAQIYKDLAKNKESIEVLNEFIEANPKSHDAYSVLAMNYMDIGEYKVALDNYEKAVSLSPENPSYLHGKAVALKYLGKTNEFMKLMQYVLSKDTKTPEVSITMGMAYLAEKNFEKGMPLYRIRNIQTNFDRMFGSRAWKPFEDISGKNVVLYSNCGLGDTIMYARYFKLVQKKAKNVVLQTDAGLVQILKNNFKDIVVFDKSAVGIKGFDVAIPVMDIPYVLGMDFSKIPLSKGYIKADKTIVKNLSKTDMFNTKLKKVGLFLQGNKRILKNRSLPLDLIKPILKNKNVKFFSLQIGADYIKNENIVDLRPYINDYNDTAALLANMDIVVTIDSSIAHMAGAMGIQTYLVLPFTPEWRWFNDDKTTPWYDSVKIYKQTEIGDWKSVISRINKDLKKL